MESERGVGTVVVHEWTGSRALADVMPLVQLRDSRVWHEQAGPGRTYCGQPITAESLAGRTDAEWAGEWWPGENLCDDCHWWGLMGEDA